MAGDATTRKKLDPIETNDASFDVVWTKYLFQWLKEPKRALKELKRVTPPGGIVVSCDFASFAIEHFPVNAKFDREVRLNLRNTSSLT